MSNFPDNFHDPYEGEEEKGLLWEDFRAIVDGEFSTFLADCARQAGLEDEDDDYLYSEALSALGLQETGK